MQFSLDRNPVLPIEKVRFLVIIIDHYSLFVADNARSDWTFVALKVIAVAYERWSLGKRF